MPRPPRIYLENALYYVTSKGDDGQRIFKDDEDFKTFLELLKRYKTQYGFKLFAFCLLPDHFHLLMELPVQKEQNYKMGGLSSIMHDLNSSYTKYFNGKYARKGHLFRERYKAALIEKGPYLLKLSAYIHLNPQKLNLTLNLQQYPYSSYIFYLSKEIPLGGLILEEKSEILDFLRGRNYAQFIDQAAVDPDFSRLHSALQKGILGTDNFSGKVKEALISHKKESPNRISVLGKKLMAGYLIAMVGALGIAYALKFTLEEKKEQGGIPLSAARYKLPEQIKELLKDLEDDEWRIRIIPLSRGAVQNDFIRFKDGKFISQNFVAKNYSSSEYFLVIEEDDKIVWESQQVGREAVASWRGEIKKGEMEGGLRLRYPDGRVQDFSFVSVECKKIGRREDG